MHNSRIYWGRLIKTAFLGLLALIVVLSVGCATRQDVQEIVAQSNEQMLIAQLPGSALPSGDPNARNDAPWVELSDRIDAFIAAHPDQTKIVSAMRIRQAMLLLAFEQYNLAQVSFSLVKAEDLTAARDQALYNVRDSLVWWFGLNKSAAMSLPQFAKADEALRVLQAEVDQRQASPAIRDYLAEIRVWIALYSSLKMTNAAKANTYLEDGINHYAKIFTLEDLTALKNPTTSASSQDSPEVVRRRLRAKAVIEYAQDVIRRQGINPSFESRDFAALIGQ